MFSYVQGSPVLLQFSDQKEDHRLNSVLNCLPLLQGYTFLCPIYFKLSMYLPNTIYNGDSCIYSMMNMCGPLKPLFLLNDYLGRISELMLSE